MILELFGGPGGLAEGARMAGLDNLVGIEWDAAACATRAAAGHRTIRADITTLDVSRLAGRVTAVCGSPECTQFSSAGSRAGTEMLGELSSLIRDMFAGKSSRSWHRNSMAKILKASGWHAATTRASRYSRKHKTRVGLSREQRSARIWQAVRSASLVAEPARYIAACDPEWIALEQVPAVLPLWQVYAEELRKRGYSAWCGVLNAADYGVPQTRERAILIASRVRTVRRPQPTHYDTRKGMQLWGTPWVSMAEALGWGATARPVPTVTAGGTRTGGAEPFGHRDRDALEAEQDAGRWALRRNRGAGMLERGGERRDHPADEPAPTITVSNGGGCGPNVSWVLHTNRGQEADGSRQTADPRSAPAPAPALTAKSGGQWKLRLDTQAKATLPRPADEPAPTIQFAHRSNLAAWVRDRPATTVQGDPRVGRPGHKDREGGEAQFEVDSVRITVEEAAALQSFPPGYPFQGTKTKQYEQVGNSFPPILAAHVLAEAAGIRRQEAAA